MHVSAAPCRPHAARGATPGRWPALRVAAALDLAKLSDKAYLDKAARRFQMGAYDSAYDSAQRACAPAAATYRPPALPLSEHVNSCSCRCGAGVRAWLFDCCRARC